MRVERRQLIERVISTFADFNPVDELPQHRFRRYKLHLQQFTDEEIETELKQLEEQQ